MFTVLLGFMESSHNLSSPSNLVDCSFPKSTLNASTSSVSLEEDLPHTISTIFPSYPLNLSQSIGNTSESNYDYNYSTNGELSRMNPITQPVTPEKLTPTKIHHNKILSASPSQILPKNYSLQQALHPLQMNQFAQPQQIMRNSFNNEKYIPQHIHWGNLPQPSTVSYLSNIDNNIIWRNPVPDPNFMDNSQTYMTTTLPPNQFHHNDNSAHSHSLYWTHPAVSNPLRGTYDLIS